MQQRHLAIPTVPTGALLNPARGYFSVIVPQATRNLVDNPSIELGTTGFASINVGASLARVATEQRYGVYALECTTLGTSIGVQRTSPTLVAGASYVFSVAHKGRAGFRYALQIYESASSFSTMEFVATGHWQRVATAVHTMLASTTVLLQVIDYQDNLQIPSYTDGWQLEAGRWATTYCDGDERGLLGEQSAYLWTGIPHASQSVRSAQTRAGGRLMRFDRLGLKILSIIGLGSILWSASALPLATGGAQFQDSTVQPSDFSLVGTVDGAATSDLGQQLSRVRDVLSYAKTAQPQPLVLRYEPFETDRQIGDPVDIACVYVPSGGTTDNNYQERVALQFKLYMPLLRSNTGAAVLDGYGTVASANYIIQRSPEGVWSKLAGGTMNNTILALVHNPANNLIYVGGAYTVGGFNARLNTYDPATDTYNVVGSGLDDPNNIVRAIAIGPAGEVYIGGDFGLIGGVVATNIAKYDLSTGLWTALGTGMNGSVRTIAVGLDGTVYAGGDFTTAGGVASAKVAKYNPVTNTWSQLAGGAGAAGGNVYALAVGRQGSIYIGGDFTSINGVANTSRIARFDPATPAVNALGTGMNGVVYAIIRDQAGDIYAGGNFSTAGGVSALMVAKWNGTIWQPLGVGLNFQASAFGLDADGTLLIGGTFTSLAGGGLPNLYGLVRWNGSAYSYPDVLLPHPSPPTTVNAILAAPDTRLFLGYDKAGTAEASQVITVTNDGTNFTWPIVTFSGPTSGAPARLYEIRNVTTGVSVWFDLSLSVGEVATLNLDPQNMSFMSSFQGNIYGSILDGSNPTGLSLQPGDNIISVLVGNDTMTVTMRWRENLISLNDAIWGR